MFIWIYNNYTEKVTNYHVNNSALISNNIHCILSALEDDLIISTEKGLTRFKTKEKIFSNWTKEQGLMSTSFNQAAGVHTRDKKFIFGCGDGGHSNWQIPSRCLINSNPKWYLIISDCSIRK